MGVTVPAALPTVTGLLLARAGDPEPGLRFEDRRWSWREHVGECARYAAALRARRNAYQHGASQRGPGRPFHVGVLADNVPEFSFLLGGCAFAGAVLVALNPVRRGEALARDVARTDCQYVLAEPGYAALLPAMDVPVLCLPRGDETLIPPGTPRAALDGLDLPARAPLEVAPATPDDLLMLIFTSGTSGEPKAVRCTHGKIAGPGRMLAGRFGLGTGDTVYVSMPMFHSNAIMAGWAVGLAAGAAIALRRRFSASGFLPDVRAFGATYANYVGKPLSYVLATPERADDADNPLRIAYGNEGAPGDLARFAERFGCTVIDGFGSTEGGVAVSRTPGTPPGALGTLADGVAGVRRARSWRSRGGARGGRPPRSWHRRGGPGHGVHRGARRGVADAGRVRRLPGRAGRPRPQAASAFRPGRGADATHGHVQGADPGAGRRPVEYR